MAETPQATLRRAYGWTLGDWSRLFRVSSGTMRRWEEGHPPSAYTVPYQYLGRVATTFSHQFKIATNASLEEVLAATRVKAGIARELRDERIASVMEDIADVIAEATRDYRIFLTEDEAIIWSGRSRSWLRRRYRELAADGHAKLSETGEKTFRRIALARRRGYSGVEEAAQRIAQSRRTRRGHDD